MTLTDPAVIKEILGRHGFLVSKKLGQNFLCDPEVIDAIVREASPAGEHVLEIGPGLGVLTRELAKDAAAVTAIEVARRLEPILAETLAEFTNIRLIFEDFLHLDADALTEDYVVASNLPYSITTPAIFRFLDEKIRWKRMVLTVQAEVGERLAAAANTREYGGLSIAAQAAADVRLICRIPSSAFWPRPKVESAVVTLTPRECSRPKNLRTILRIAFSQRRKTLKNALSSLPKGFDAIGACGLDPSQRPGTVPVESWLELARYLE